jgi:iron uptake system component EfeO
MFTLRRDRARRSAATTGLLAAGALLLSGCAAKSVATGSPSGPAASGVASSAGASSAGASSSVAAPAGAAASGAAASGAGSSSPGSSAATPGGPASVAITITDAKGCIASPDMVVAGAVTFTVKNIDATGITELELLSDQRILGERENLTPGFDSTFSVTVDGGSYQIYCPGGATEKIPFTVTGQAAAVATGSTATLLQTATVHYSTYVDNRSNSSSRPSRSW